MRSSGPEPRQALPGGGLVDQGYGVGGTAVARLAAGTGCRTWMLLIKVS